MPRRHGGQVARKKRWQLAKRSSEPPSQSGKAKRR